MATATHTAIDGSTVTLAGETDLDRPVTSSVHLRQDGILRELTGAPVEAIGALPFSPVEEYTHAGGTLRIGERLDIDPVLESRRLDRAALWFGRDHGLVLVETAGTTETLLAVLDGLVISESATGITIEGAAVLGATTKLVKELPGTGLAEVTPLVPDVARGLPRWAGTEVAGGELYRDEARPGVPVLVLVGDTAVTTVLVEAGSGGEADRATTTIAGLRVTWEAPP